MKEAMQKNRRMTEDEFVEIATTMMEVPRKEKEKQRDYFQRLKRYGITRSRFTLQIIEAALREESKDMGKSFNIYREKMAETNTKGENSQEQMDDKQIPGQIEMEMTKQGQEKNEMSERVKTQRFQAEMVTNITKAIEDSFVLLNTELDKLNDTLSMILRAMRKE